MMHLSSEILFQVPRIINMSANINKSFSLSLRAVWNYLSHQNSYPYCSNGCPSHSSLSHVCMTRGEYCYICTQSMRKSWAKINITAGVLENMITRKSSMWLKYYILWIDKHSKAPAFLNIFPVLNKWLYNIFNELINWKSGNCCRAIIAVFKMFYIIRY